MKHMRKCSGCAAYTFSEKCRCGSPTAAPKPAKFSPEDHYGQYRRRAKEAMLKEKGLI